MASSACGGYNYHQSQGHRDLPVTGVSINNTLKIVTTPISMARERNQREHDSGEGKERWKGRDLSLGVMGCVCVCVCV